MANAQFIAAFDASSRAQFIAAFVSPTLVPIKFNQPKRISLPGVYRSSTYVIPSVRYGMFEYTADATLLPIKCSFNIDEISKGHGPITAAQLGGILVGGS